MDWIDLDQDRSKCASSCEHGNELWIPLNAGNGRPRHRWENNIKMDLQEVGSEGMDWIDLTQDRDS